MMSDIPRVLPYVEAGELVAEAVDEGIEVGSIETG